MRIGNFSTWVKGITLFSMLALLLASCASNKIIVNGLDEREANEILVFLANKNISATKVKAEGGGAGGSKAVLWNIQVAEEKATEAMALLNIAGLPRRPGQSLLGIFAGGGLVPSQMEEKIRFQAGLAAQIASVIRKIDGVLDADVQLSVPEEDPLNPEKNKNEVSASVYVKHSGVLDDPNAHLTTKIRRLVSSSIPGLKFDNVTVIGDRARYSDVTQAAAARKPERQFTSVWTILVANESLGRFRWLFFTYSILTLLSLLGFMWLMWKVYPIIKEVGGLKKLLSFRPLAPGAAHFVAPVVAKEEKKSVEQASVPSSEEKPKEQEGLVEPGDIK